MSLWEVFAFDSPDGVRAERAIRPHEVSACFVVVAQCPHKPRGSYLREPATVWMSKSSRVPGVDVRFEHGNVFDLFEIAFRLGICDVNRAADQIENGAV